MTGKDVVLQKLAEDEDLLVELANERLGCPRHIGLKEGDGCNTFNNCTACWRNALEQEVS
jgi:hypothetical protein